MNPETSLRERYLEVKERIARAAKRAGRDSSTVLMVAVSKYAEPDQIRELIKLGHADFGENKVQQLIQRAPMIDEWLARHRAMPGVNLPRPGGADALGAAASAGQVRWHMVGHLQRNKARKVVELCRLIHSVDSLRLAEELQLIAAKREKPVEVLLQVNCSGEASKFGCAIGATIHLAEQIETMVQVKVRGLMTMAPHTAKPDDSRRTFGRCRELFLEVRDSGVVSPDFNILSMGMSGDFEIGIEEGANMVRVGSAIFGEPKPGTVEDDDREAIAE
jgi:pyridoxal phosphate enzyme (YggS family)